MVEEIAEYSRLARCTRAENLHFLIANRKSGRKLLVYHIAWAQPYNQT